jgi:SAM-dependent methyltransferase
VTFAELQQTIGRKYARLVTNVVVRRPWLWRFFRRSMRLQFDRLAPVWTGMRAEDAFAPLELALGQVGSPPRNVLDLGTGTGLAAFLVARRFPEAEVIGADLAPEMLAEARRGMPPELAGRVRFEEADASQLQYANGSFELVSLANMIPFFDELARVVAPDGHVVLSFSVGAQTPIYVPFDVLRAELSARGFTDFADFEAGAGTALLARKAERS